MARRGNNEGSITKRKSDGRYMSRITTIDGKRKAYYGKDQAGRGEEAPDGPDDRAPGLAAAR